MKEGTKLKCKDCKGESTIIREDGRYYVFCHTEQKQYLLKEHNVRTSKQRSLFDLILRK